jgi:hypothetical protein
MAELVPAIHALTPHQALQALAQPNRMDGRDKPGHDGGGAAIALLRMEDVPRWGLVDTAFSTLSCYFDISGDITGPIENGFDHDRQIPAQSH